MRIKDIIIEKAVSKKQQRFMGMVHALQKGEKVKSASAELKKVAKDMKKSDAKDFAKTKHKGLPNKKKKTESINEEQLNEWIIPAIVGALRIAAPAARKLLMSKGAKQVAKTVAKGAGKGAEIVVKNPGKSLMAYGAYKTFETVDEFMTWLKELDVVGLGKEIALALADVVVKNAIPIGVILAVLVGGWKLIDMLAGDDDEKRGGDIHNHYYAR